MPASSSITRMLPPVAPDANTGPEERFKDCSTSDMYRLPYERKLKVECCAGSDGAFDVNFARVLLNDPVGDRQAESRSASLPRPRSSLGGEERIVDALEMFRRNA